LLAARWFTRADLRARRAARGRLGNQDSIDRLLLESWLDAGADIPVAQRGAGLDRGAASGT
jgi:NAD+ diphosphatase